MDKRLIDTIEKIKTLSSQNAEFDAAMRELFGKTDSASSVFSGSPDGRIDEIYEYCIERVIKEQSEQFYKYFPIQEIVPQLVEDFCRMERYKREDNFEDFCLAVFQQVECITNWFCQRERFIKLYESKKETDSSVKDKSGNTLSVLNLIIKTNPNDRKELPLMDLFFNDRIRAVLYFVYFEEQTYKYVFDFKYKELDELYQCRNLNHRGGVMKKYQEDVISYIIPRKYQYYLKFTGLLVDFVGHIGEYMAKKEAYGTVVNKLECGYVYIRPDSEETFVIDKGRLLFKVKSFSIGDRVAIERNSITNEIVDINRVAE